QAPRRKPSPARQASARRPAASRETGKEARKDTGTDRLERDFAQAMARHAGQAAAVAVSGGGDSLALMHLVAGHAGRQGHPLPIILTVDHGLRPSSAKDAKAVAAWAARAGLEAKVLTWRGKKPATGIEAAAREARYRLMGAYLAKHKIATLFVGHNQDDQ